ncbi:hypothetical protein THAOC_31116 [Thalassiosira oceanica]|uniref:Uncharacterized protein n=1 Tax=Thalassiosira oceanica TaxID=159749 RepID=K0R9X0_THAOC|nr:hypothetical protein THAOC_31116 [Thalassiosira oceanica]|eukprot:EJK49955.1 hypothetical protein THAOC_31116 [Thalassiosira oceanica]
MQGASTTLCASEEKEHILSASLFPDSLWPAGTQPDIFTAGNYGVDRRSLGVAISVDPLFPTASARESHGAASFRVVSTRRGVAVDSEASVQSVSVLGYLGYCFCLHPREGHGQIGAATFVTLGGSRSKRAPSRKRVTIPRAFTASSLRRLPGGRGGSFPKVDWVTSSTQYAPLARVLRRRPAPGAGGEDAERHGVHSEEQEHSGGKRRLLLRVDRGGRSSGGA